MGGDSKPITPSQRQVRLREIANEIAIGKRRTLEVSSKKGKK